MEIVATYHEPRMTGGDIAERFASSLGRKIDVWNGNRFRFVDGIFWYTVSLDGERWVIIKQ